MILLYLGNYTLLTYSVDTYCGESKHGNIRTNVCICVYCVIHLLDEVWKVGSLVESWM